MLTWLNTGLTLKFAVAKVTERGSSADSKFTFSSPWSECHCMLWGILFFSNGILFFPKNISISVVVKLLNVLNWLADFFLIANYYWLYLFNYNNINQRDTFLILLILLLTTTYYYLYSGSRCWGCMISKAVVCMVWLYIYTAMWLTFPEHL